MAVFRRVGASPHNKIFCVRGMDIFLNTKEKSIALILFQKLREYTTMALKANKGNISLFRSSSYSVCYSILICLVHFSTLILFQNKSFTKIIQLIKLFQSCNTTSYSLNLGMPVSVHWIKAFKTVNSGITIFKHSLSISGAFFCKSITIKEYRLQNFGLI